jgi:hypothetical protein
MGHAGDTSALKEEVDLEILKDHLRNLRADMSTLSEPSDAASIDTTIDGS